MAMERNAISEAQVLESSGMHLQCVASSITDRLPLKRWNYSSLSLSTCEHSRPKHPHVCFADQGPTAQRRFMRYTKAKPLALFANLYMGLWHLGGSCTQRRLNLGKAQRS
jgi:hypothetical protein